MTSRFLNPPAHPKVISERLGHSTVAMTLDLYSHAIPALQHDAVATIADLVGGAAATAVAGLRWNASGDP
jgi:integrase